MNEFLVDHIAPNAPEVESFEEFVRTVVHSSAEGRRVTPGFSFDSDLKKRIRLASAEAGFYAAEYPAHLGGRALPFRVKSRLIEASESSPSPLARVAISNAEGPSPALLEGTPIQQQRFLRPLVEGQATRALALSEPTSGSDAFALQTKATHQDGSWVLHGRKVFVSGATDADMLLVYARDSQQQRGAPILFVVDPRSPGVTIHNSRSGLSGEVLSDILLDGVKVSADRAVISADERASRWAAMTNLAKGRLIVASVANGISRRAMTLGMDFVRSRSTRGTPLGTFQHVQAHFVQARAAIEGSKLATHAAAVAFDNGEDVLAQASLAKLMATEGAKATVDSMLQVMGAAGWDDGEMQFLYRYARGMTIVEGTSEIQKVVVASGMGLY